MGYPWGAECDPNAPWNQPADERKCEYCNFYQLDMGFLQNTEGEFICPDCAAKQRCEICDAVDPFSQARVYDGDRMNLCLDCQEALKDDLD